MSISIFPLKDCYWWSICLNILSWLIDLLIEAIMTVKIEIVSTSWVSMVTLDSWCVQLLLIFSFLYLFFFTFLFYWFFKIWFCYWSCFFFLCWFTSFLLLTIHWYDAKMLKHFLQIELENIVITNSPDKDMIVADHMNQVNLRCVTVTFMVHTHLL
jgi:hypothetical protein